MSYIVFDLLLHAVARVQFGVDMRVMPALRALVHAKRSGSRLIISWDSLTKKTSVFLKMAAGTCIPTFWFGLPTI